MGHELFQDSSRCGLPTVWLQIKPLNSCVLSLSTEAALPQSQMNASTLPSTSFHLQLFLYSTLAGESCGHWNLLHWFVFLLTPLHLDVFILLLFFLRFICFYLKLRARGEREHLLVTPQIAVKPELSQAKASGCDVLLSSPTGWQWTKRTWAIIHCFS